MAARRRIRGTWDEDIIKAARRRKRDTRQRNYATQRHVSLPSYWHLSGSERGQSQSYVEVCEKSKAAIIDAVVKTWERKSMGQGRDARGLASCSIKVLSVKRLENKVMYSNYLSEKEKLFGQCEARGKTCPDIQTLPGSAGRVRSTEVLPDFMKGELNWKVNEVYLFHGTKAENIKSILTNGLDPAYSNPSGMFGRAVYTTESSTKADQYTDKKCARSDPGSDLFMILARVLLGRVFVCDSRPETQNLKGPPCTSCKVHKCTCLRPSRYDSVMADGEWMFREFAIYHNYRCYPEYVIKYRRERKSSLHATRLSRGTALPPPRLAPRLAPLKTPEAIRNRSRRSVSQLPHKAPLNSIRPPLRPTSSEALLKLVERALSQIPKRGPLKSEKRPVLQRSRGLLWRDRSHNSLDDFDQIRWEDRSHDYLEDLDQIRVEDTSHNFLEYLDQIQREDRSHNSLDDFDQIRSEDRSYNFLEDLDQIQGEDRSHNLLEDLDRIRWKDRSHNSLDDIDQIPWEDMFHNALKELL